MKRESHEIKVAPREWERRAKQGRWYRKLAPKECPRSYQDGMCEKLWIGERLKTMTRHAFWCQTKPEWTSPSLQTIQGGEKLELGSAKLLFSDGVVIGMKCSTECCQDTCFMVKWVLALMAVWMFCGVSLFLVRLPPVQEELVRQTMRSAR